MTINLHSEPGHRERLMIQMSEFSYAAYAVQINHAFRCLPDAASALSQSRNRWPSGLRRRTSRWLRWACGERTAAPAPGNLSLEQAVP